ncbi:MAG: M14 metallopeptidase family protein [Acidobacteriota bacterium]
MNTLSRRLILSALVMVCCTAIAIAQNRLTSPKDHFGFNISDDYQLANYTQYEAYIKKLDAESDRMKLVEIGKSAEGRTMYVGIITSPENFKKLDRYKEIAARLARAEGLNDDQARALAKEGKAVVWIDGGLHATEVLGPAQLIETIWQLNSRTDEETQRFLNDVIILTCLVNPDGMELVSNWYMREQEPTKRSYGSIPRLYQKYIGHDNNRDFYLSSQPESEAINRMFYHEWFPQIIYNHHQTGPAGTVLFAPPFRDPFNYLFDPMVVTGVDLVGAAMHQRFVAENKPGATTRTGTGYSTWWNGGLRTTVYFHNMVGLLTETIGSPTPMEIPFVVNRQLPQGNLVYPVQPQKWHFRQSIEYSITANRAVLDVAAKNREDFLFNIYQMGRNSIERGSRDNWTVYPKRLDEVQATIDKDRRPAGEGRAAGGDGQPEQADIARAAGFSRGVPLKYYEMLRKPELRDPRGYVIPSSQPDFLTATKFVNALIKNGITIHRATAEFTVNGKSYPAGSYVVKAAQAFRPHVLDMFEPQDHPNDFQYPGGPPIPPYDNAGWTLAMQMGVKFDRILDGFDGPFEKITGFAKPTAGKVALASNAVTYVLSHQTNDSFIAINRLLKDGEDVYWSTQPLKAADQTLPPGTIFITAKTATAARLQKIATEFGLSFGGMTYKPQVEMLKLKQPRIALWDRYGGSMPSGWTRWILEQYEFPFTVVFPQTLDAGNLADKFDVIVFVTGAIPAREARGGGPGGGDEPFIGRAPRAEDLPEEFRGWLGNVSLGKTVPQLKAFIEAGGTVLAIGTSTNLGYHLGLPMANALMEKSGSGDERPLGRDKYYIPGSLLQVSMDNTNPLAYGMPDKVDVFFDNSPVFRLKPEASLKGLKPVAWFDSGHPLRSGWAWGQKYLQDGVAVIDASFGKGKLFLYGPEILFRAQPHGTFKLLFNGIYYGPAQPVK